MTYFDGDLYKQTWTGQTSTECRLVPNTKLSPRNWDIHIYESMMFYQNNVVRENIKFINPLTNINESISDELGLTQDWDSTVFALTVKDYLLKFKADSSPDEVIKLSGSIINDIGKDVVNIIGLRSGDISGNKLINIQRIMKEMRDENEE